MRLDTLNIIFLILGSLTVLSYVNKDIGGMQLFGELFLCVLIMKAGYYLFDGREQIAVCRKCGFHWARDSRWMIFEREEPQLCEICQSELFQKKNVRIFKYMNFWRLIGQPQRYIDKLKQKEEKLWIVAKI